VRGAVAFRRRLAEDDRANLFELIFVPLVEATVVSI
jgi:hypothetical protein